MKREIARLLLLISITVGCEVGTSHCRASADEDFTQGMEAYQTGRFVEAAKAFGEAVAERPAAGTLVNLGMTEWRRGRTGAAIVAWEQALWVDAFDERARNNLQFARETAGLDAPRLAWYKRPRPGCQQTVGRGLRGPVCGWPWAW